MPLLTSTNHAFSCYFPSNLGPDDYQPVNISLTFDGSTNRSVFSIFLENDDVDELDESFSNRLRLDSADPSITLDPSATTITIVDDDGEFSRWSW